MGLPRLGAMRRAGGGGSVLILPDIVRIGASLLMIEDHQTMCEIGTMERYQLHCPPSSLTLFPSLVRPFPSIVRSPTFASEPLPERPPSSPTVIPLLALSSAVGAGGGLD